jgi:3-hydroxyacyl-[acyl-carrier-protein] dehydratase
MSAGEKPVPAMREAIRAALLSGPTAEPDGGTAFEFRFPKTEPIFAGHFPGQPLVPGIFQTEMARLAAETALASPLEIRQIVRAKFLRPILPEETIRLSLKFEEHGPMIQARATLVAGGQAAGAASLNLCRSA